MVYIPAGNFTLGSDNQEFLEEQIVEDVTVNDFCIDRHEVTNQEFRQFVEATGYVTVAQRDLPAEQFPQLSPEQRQAGSLVFQPPPSSPL